MTQKKDRSGFLLYKSPEGEVHINVALEVETVWLTQKAMAELFGVSKSTISEHLNNIYDTVELVKSTTVRNFRTVQMEGQLERRSSVKEILTVQQEGNRAYESDLTSW